MRKTSALGHLPSYSGVVFLLRNSCSGQCHGARVHCQLPACEQTVKWLSVLHQSAALDFGLARMNQLNHMQCYAGIRLQKAVLLYTHSSAGIGRAPDMHLAAN